MTSIRPVVLVTGALVAALGVMMIAPILVDLSAETEAHRANWTAFATASIICIFVGGGAALASRGGVQSINVRQTFLLTAVSWVSLAAFAAIPLTLGNLQLSYTDAFFEAMSGITTTGSTIITGLDHAPSGVLLWRSMLQWIGGIGIVIMAFSILPALRVGGMQVFKSEAWDTSEKFVANAGQYSAALTGIYTFFTALCFFMLWLCGMPVFDALNHAMTTVATGGFSTKDASLGAFLSMGNAPLDLVVVAFMIIGSLPFGLFLLALMKGDIGRLFNDGQVQFFILTIIVLTMIMLWYVFARFETEPFTAFRLALFNVVSILTGTGYATADYDSWGPFAIGFFFCMMFIGGCAGSTSCGLKIFRFQVALAALRVYAKRLAHPNGVFVARYNNHALTDDIFISVLSFFFVYFASFATFAVVLSMFDLDPITAISAAGTAIANVGPGLGDVVGPAGNFSSLPIGAKWVMSAGMLIGRLEFFAVLVLFSPSFWRS